LQLDFGIQKKEDEPRDGETGDGRSNIVVIEDQCAARSLHIFPRDQSDPSDPCQNQESISPGGIDGDWIMLCPQAKKYEWDSDRGQEVW